ncbi:MAG: ABC transporter ATP-binding protein [Devosia sp.]|nr:ABC transporter ATP-binding protein [Devosia sp.]
MYAERLIETSRAAASADAAPDAIDIRKVDKTYRRGATTVQALSDVDLTIERGEFLTLFGPSGCGKSTLLRIIAGLETQSGGEVLLFGQTPATASRRKNVSWIPQSSALLPWLSIRDNALLSDFVNRRADREPHPERVTQDVDLVLEEMKLSDFANALPAQLSGGMRQRAAIARGFVQGAPLMLMDEPFSALDELTRDTLRWHLLDIWERHRKTVVFVTHSAEEAALLSDRVAVMTPRPGRISALIDIDLPRPRTAELAESPEFHAKVNEIKRTLREGWKGEDS